MTLHLSENLMHDVIVFHCISVYFDISCQEICAGSILHPLKHFETHLAVAPGLQQCPKHMRTTEKKETVTSCHEDCVKIGMLQEPV